MNPRKINDRNGRARGAAAARLLRVSTLGAAAILVSGLAIGALDAGGASAAAAPSCSAAVCASFASAGGTTRVLTVTNTPSSVGPITGFVMETLQAPTDVSPASACSLEEAAGQSRLKCIIGISQGASAHVCFSGVTQPVIALQVMFAAGFEDPLAAEQEGPATSICGSGAGPVSRCVVPNLKNRKLASAEQALAQAHCAVGQVRRAPSKRVKKGSVISQSLPAGKSSPKGTRVALVVSKGT
jgi:PASTA domain-containing protein